MAEPMPAAAMPYQGPSSHPESRTTQSPKFTYPWVGEGIWMTMVATQHRAMNRAVMTSCLICFDNGDTFFA